MLVAAMEMHNAARAESSSTSDSHDFRKSTGGPFFTQASLNAHKSYKTKKYPKRIHDK